MRTSPVARSHAVEQRCRGGRARTIVLCAVLAVASAVPTAASGAVLTRVVLGDPDGLELVDTDGLTTGADGNLWFYDHGDIVRMTPSGSVSRFDARVGDETTVELAAGPDGNIWYAATHARRIGRVTPSGSVTTFSKGIHGPVDIAAGADGNVWFTEPARTRVGRITPAGVVTAFSAGITPDSGLSGIAAGHDGNVWFGVLATGRARIGRITPAGRVTEFSRGLPRASDPWDMTAGPDGNVWFTDLDDAVGRITPAGKITMFSAGIEPDSEPWTIAAGPDGNLWFTESETGRLGRVTPAGQITEFSAGLGPNDFIVSTITAGPGGSLWFGTFDGIAALTPTPGTAVSVATRRARVSATGSTTVDVVCGAGTEPCAGSFELTIRTRRTIRPGGGDPPFTVPKVVVVGSGRYSLRPGQRRGVKVTVNASGRRRLASRGRLDTRYRAPSSAGDARGGLVLAGTRRG